MRQSGGAVTWLSQDHQATTMLAINSVTLETTRRRFLPFGGERGGVVDFLRKKGFVGGTIDAAAGLTTLGARQYDPGLGRFLSVDPLMDLSDPQQMHGYAYANNNPVTFSDPSGLLPGAGAYRPPSSGRDKSRPGVGAYRPPSNGRGKSRPTAAVVVSTSKPVKSTSNRGCRMGGCVLSVSPHRRRR